MGSSASSEADQLEYADECVARGIAAREKRNYKAALRYFEEAFRIRTAMLSADSSVNYSEPYVRIQVLIGEVHFWLGSFDRALFYLLNAFDTLDPLMDLPSIRRTTALTQYVNLTAGLILVYTKVAAEEDAGTSCHASLKAAMCGMHPLDLAETQLERAIEVVTKMESSRSSNLITLYHMKARVLMARRKAMAALRSMQRCLGLTLHLAQTKQIFSFLSYTRNVLDAIKRHAEKDAAAIKIQLWWRERKTLNFHAGTSSIEARRSQRQVAVRSPNSSPRFGRPSAHHVPSDETYASVNSDHSDCAPALPPQQSGSFHNPGVNDILARLHSEIPTPGLRDTLPGELVAPDMDANHTPRNDAGHHVYSALNYFNQQATMPLNVRLWEIPPEA